MKKWRSFLENFNLGLNLNIMYLLQNNIITDIFRIYTTNKKPVRPKIKYYWVLFISQWEMSFLSYINNIYANLYRNLLFMNRNFFKTFQD